MFRTVPISIKITNVFGGFLNQFGWLFFGFGMIFFWIFGAKADFSFIHFRGEVVTVQGISLGAYETSYSSNEVPVVENLFKFTDSFGDEWQGISYATGRYYNEGDEVTVEYPKGKPEYARIQGMRISMFGPWVLFVTIFPLIGLMFIVFGFKLGLKANRLLKKGIITQGKLVKKERTQTEINEQPVYKLTFIFKDRLGYEQEAIVKTYRTHELEDDKYETLLFMENNPEKVILADALPGKVKIDESGIIAGTSGSKALAVSILPLVSIIGHGGYFMAMIG